MALFPLMCLAQYKIEGNVTAVSGEPLPQVAVALLRPDSSFVKGSASDANGFYRLEDVASDSYVLVFKMLGYDPRQVAITVGGDMIVDVAMEPVSVSLGEVGVAASGFIRKDDCLLVVPDEQSVKHSTTGYDLLNNLMIPGVYVDRRTKSVRTSKGEVSLYIDGRKVDSREVQQLRPKDVERIEYMDQPKGKYANDLVVVNYITKQYASGGYVSTDALQGIGYLKGDYNVSAKLSSGKTSYTLFGGHAMERTHGHGQRHEMLMFPDNPVSRDNVIDDVLNKSNQQYVQLNVNNRDERHNIVLNATFVRNSTPASAKSGRLAYGNLSSGEILFEEMVLQKGLRPGASFHGEFKIKDNHTLNLDFAGGYSDNTYARTYTEGAVNTDLESAEGLWDFNASANYDLRLRNKDVLSAQFYHFQTFSSLDYHGSANEHQELVSGESLLFLQYSHKFKDRLNIYLHPGVSLLNYKLNGELSRFWSLRANASISYLFPNNGNLAWWVNIGNISPNISFLNDAEQEVDFLQVQRGNPDLDNTKIYNTSLSYDVQLGKAGVALGVGYNFFPHYLFDDYYIEGGKLVRTYSTDGDYSTVMAYASLSWRVTEDLRIGLNGNYRYAKADGRESMDCHTFSGSATFNYYWRDFSLYAYVSTGNERLVGMTMLRTPWKYGLSIAWHHRGWSVEAGTDNLFVKDNKTCRTIDFTSYYGRMTDYDRRDQQWGYVRASYTIDFGRKVSRDANKVNRNINSAIMKVE